MENWVSTVFYFSIRREDREWTQAVPLADLADRELTVGRRRLGRIWMGTSRVKVEIGVGRKRGTYPEIGLTQKAQRGRRAVGMAESESFLVGSGVGVREQRSVGGTPKMGLRSLDLARRRFLGKVQWQWQVGLLCVPGGHKKNRDGLKMGPRPNKVDLTSRCTCGTGMRLTWSSAIGFGPVQVRRDLLG